MKLQKLIITGILALAAVVSTSAQEQKVIKGFSGGMMIHSGYQFGGDNPYWLLAINNEGVNRPMGPRLYFGCIFAH